MIVHMGAKYRAYPQSDLRSLAGRMFGCCRVAHNVARDQRRMFGRKGRNLGYAAQTQELPALKAEFSWMKDCYSQCLQQALRDLDDAYQRFFKGQGGYPKPWKKYEDDSLRFPQIRQVKQEVDKETGEVTETVTDFVKFLPDGIHLPGGLGFLRVSFHRPLPGKPKSVTLTRKGSGDLAEWHISVLCEVEIADPIQVRPHWDSSSGRQVAGFDWDALLKGFTGVDFGCAKPKDDEPNNAYVTADGDFFDVPGETAGEAIRRRSLEHGIARCVKAREAKEAKARAEGTLAKTSSLPMSHREQERRDELRALDGRVRRRRHDALHKITTALAKNHGLIGLEDLHIKGMTASAKGTVEEPGKNVAAKAALNRRILGNAFGAFKRMLAYKCFWYGCALVQVRAAYTSQTCSECRRHPKDLLALGIDERAALPEHERTLVLRWEAERETASAVAKERGTASDWEMPHGRVSRSAFVCPLCGFACHADINAARNVQRLALAEFGRKVRSGAWIAEEAERKAKGEHAAKRKLAGKTKKAEPSSSSASAREGVQSKRRGTPVAARGALDDRQATKREEASAFQPG